MASNWRVRGRDKLCRSNATVRGWQEVGSGGLIRCPSRKTSAVAAFASLYFPENGTDLSRFRNGIPCRRWLVALRKACGMPVANGGVMEKLKPLHCLAFVLITLFLASCASQTQPTTTSPPPQPLPSLSLPWTETVVTASLPLYISEAVGLRSNVRPWFDRIGKPKPLPRDSLHPPLQRPGKTGRATSAFQADFASLILEDLGAGGLESRAGNRIAC